MFREFVILNLDSQNAVIINKCVFVLLYIYKWLLRSFFEALRLIPSMRY